MPRHAPKSKDGDQCKKAEKRGGGNIPLQCESLRCGRRGTNGNREDVRARTSDAGLPRYGQWFNPGLRQWLRNFDGDGCARCVSTLMDQDRSTTTVPALAPGSKAETTPCGGAGGKVSRGVTTNG